MSLKYSISVALCTYNGVHYLEEQLQSILGQALMPFQVVVSDDCSSDNTWRILNTWKDRYPTIIEIYRQPRNVGFNKNFEFVLSKVKGDYVALSDQDDIWHLDKLKVLSDYASRFPEVDVFHHDEAIFGKNVATDFVDSNYWLPYEGNGAGIVFVLNRLTGHKLMIKTTMLADILPIPDYVIYDWWINVVVAIKGVTMYVPQKLMTYRQHENSAYFSNVSKQLSDVTIPVRRALNAFDKISGTSAFDKKNLKKLIVLYEKHTPQKFDVNMFRFFLRNRNDFFKEFHTKMNGIGRQIFLIRLCRAFSKW